MSCTKVNAIKISGGFATTTDVNTAKSSAVSTAATDAQAKASAAQTAASTDASTKANTAQTNTLNSSKTYTDTLKNSLKGLAYQDKVGSAMCDTTLIVGGYLKTSLIDVNWLKANVINADFISALSVDFKQGTIGGFKITASAISSIDGKTVLNKDGSGSFGGGNFKFDLNGNIYLNGRVSTNFIEITPQSNISITTNNIIVTT